MIHTELNPPASAVYREALRFTGLQQIPVAFLFALDLHGGLIVRFFCVATGFWMGVGLIFAKRRFAPTRADIRYIRWGFFPLLFTSSFLAVGWSRWWLGLN